MTPSPVPATPLPTLSRPLPECHFGLFRFLYCLCLPSMNMSLNNTGLDLLVSSFIKNAPEILLPLALLNSVICVSDSPTWMPVAKIHSLSRAYSIFHCVRVPQLPLPSPADGPLGGIGRSCYGHLCACLPEHTLMRFSGKPRGGIAGLCRAQCSFYFSVPHRAQWPPNRPQGQHAGS